MPKLVTRESFKKSETTKEEVDAEGAQRVKDGIAESYTIEDDAKGGNWVLVTVVKQIS